MNRSRILASEFLKTRRSTVKKIALASPLCLAMLAVVQQGYFSLNLFNWYYVVFLPATFALISAAAVNLDHGKLGLRAIRCLPIEQGRIWNAKLLVVAFYALLSCLLLSVAVMIIPQILSLLGTEQIKPLSLMTVLLAILVMFASTVWQIPLCFILAKKCGLVVTVVLNLFVSFSGVLVALKPYWMACPWAWVNRSMISVLGVLPNGLPVENGTYTQPHDVALALIASILLTAVLSVLSTFLYKRSEAR